MPQKRPKALLLIIVLLLLVLPATAVVLPGRITVYSTPSGALACIDTTACDTTPATFPVEGNAWHMIVVTEKGYRDWIETVYVTTDQTSRADAYLDLDPAVTAIHVNVTPLGGTVCLDNTQCRANSGPINGTAGILFTGVSPGYHTISVESPPDFLDTQKLVQVSLGKTTEVNIALEAYIAPVTTAPAAPPVTGMVRVYVDRTGSTICMDNARCVSGVGGSAGSGTGTMVFNDVTVNETHIVTVAADGYQPFSATVSVGKDLITVVNVSLRPLGGVTLTPSPSFSVATTPSQVTSPTPATTATPPPTMPLQTRSPLGAFPVIGALFLSGMGLLFLKQRE